MLYFKKVTALLTLIITSVLVLAFCLLFTAPGNQLIAYSANKLVDGLTVNLEEGRFLYNDAFDIDYHQNGLSFSATQLKIDLYWWQCQGLCLDNLSARSVALTLPASDNTASSAEQHDITENNLAQTRIALPIKVNVKNIAIKALSVNHPSAAINVHDIVITAQAIESKILLNSMTLANVTVALKEAKSVPNESLTVLPALPTVALTFPVDIELQHLFISQLGITATEQPEPHIIRDIELALMAQGSTLQLTTLNASFQQWQLNAQLAAKLIDENPLNADIVLTHPQHHVHLRLDGKLNALRLALDTQGEYPLTLKAEANLQRDNYPFSLLTQFTGWHFATAQGQLKINDVNFSGQGHANDYQFNLAAMGQLGAYPAVQLSTDIAGGLEQLTVKYLELNAHESKVNLLASLNWQQGFDSHFSGDLSHFKAQYLTDAIATDLSGKFKGGFKVGHDDWQLFLEDTVIKGHVNEVPLTIASDLKLDNHLQAHINKLEIVSGDNIVSLSGKVDEQWRVDGIIELNAHDHKVMPLSGQGVANVKVRGKRLAPLAELDLILHTLRYQDSKVDDLTLKARFDYAADWQTDLSLTLDSAMVAGQQINQIEITGSGDKTDHYLSLLVDAQQGQLKLAVEGQFANHTWQGILSNVLLSDNTVRFSNDKPVKIVLNSDTMDFSVAAHCWQSQLSKLCFKTLQQRQQLGTLVANLDNLALPELQHFLPKNVRLNGGLTGEFNANWQADKLDALSILLNSNALSATLIDGQERYQLPIEQLTVSVTGDANNAQLDTTIDSSVLGKITSKINVDDIQNTQILAGQLQIDKVLLSDLQPFIGLLEQLKGEITGQLMLSGSVQEPLLNGRLAVREISLSGTELPIALQNSNLELVFDRTTATMQGQLNDLEGGTLSVSGDVDWQGEKPIVHVDLAGQQFFVRAQQDVVFKVSPALTISLQDNAFKLAGQVVVPYGRIKIDELPEGAVQVSNDEVIVDIQQEKSQQVPFDYDIDLKLLVNDDVRVDSFGLQSKIAGDLRIKMDQNTPMITIGELNLVEGTYRAFGQDLFIRMGQVGFSGSIEQPYLNIRAIRNPENTANNVIAGVTLTGSAEQPVLKVFSEPAMDQGQALAYLLNGQPLGEGDSSSDAMLTQLLLAQGVSRSESMVSKVGETIGLSDVSLTSKGSGDETKVEISGYVAPGIQVKYRVGVFDSLSEVAIRYQLLSQLYIEVTSGLYQNVDVLYKFDWDE
ncbi:translocation/assembly module TamB domain-containing protein [Pseudoalteromonas mariniglutinosa]|uniref:autotransporter assembly complex protein TamB n=1 Tax=Pseudoalteromonas mariniglutinosa TaxID=206042 RepID=UPI00384ECAB4